MSWWKLEQPNLVETKYMVVEVEKPRKVAELTEDSRKSVAGLAGHPGFEYLLAKLKLQKSLLETTLKTTRHTKIEDVQFLQSGIFWCDWLNNQVLTELNRPAAPKGPASQIEGEIFTRLQAEMEAVK